MQTATTVALMVLRLAGLVQIVLGLLFWTGRALTMVSIHMLVGFVLVLALWTLAVLAARAGVSLGLVIVATLWGLVVPVLGLTQARLLPGDLHWVIQVIHLLVGLFAIGLGETLAERIKQAPTASALPA